MSKEFNFKSSITDIQNRLISQSIRDTSNIQLLKSEEAIQQVIKSYTDKFKTVDGMLTDAMKYVVKSKDIIRTSQFNDLFESIYIDLSALYNDLELVESVLTLNISRNKTFFQVIKKRVKDLWNRLYLTRLNIFDSDPADESYYESFNADINFNKSLNITIDKKTGLIYLEPIKRRVNNDSYIIKEITSITYPVDNPDGGVINTTDKLNSLNYNYIDDGTHDMLQNGLWKEQLLCYDVPNLNVNIGSESNEIRKNYKGIVSIVDITFTYPVEINRYDFDIFGEASLLIDSILYKETDSDSWRLANFQNNDPLVIDPRVSGFYAATGEQFDIISLMNVVKHKVKKLRLVFNQKNYILLNKENSVTIKDSVQTDLSERRYELAKFGISIEDSLSKPILDKNISVYNQLINVLETTRNIRTILRKIEDILIPEVRIVTKDFSKYCKFELGTWSIEPMLEQYTNLEGIYDSKPYSIKNKSLLSVAVKSGQTVPEASTCNWYINIKNKNIPVMENNAIIRKEPFNVIDLGSYHSKFTSWPGIFVQLDFPVNPGLTNQLGYYRNGEFKYDISDDILFLNSSLIYFKYITDPYSASYVIRYPSASDSSVNLYTLSPKINKFKHIPLGIVASRKYALEFFINNVNLRDTSQPLATVFKVSSIASTFDESKKWFSSEYGLDNNAFTTCLFVADEILNLFSSTSFITHNYINSSITKLNTSISYNQTEFYELSSSLANLVPISENRRI